MAPIDKQNKPALRLVCLSDLHDAQQTVSVPDGDVLIVAGDICLEGRLADQTFRRMFMYAAASVQTRDCRKS